MTFTRAFKRRLTTVFRKQKLPTTPQAYTVPRPSLTDSEPTSWIQISRPPSPKHSPQSRPVSNQASGAISNANNDEIPIIGLGEEHDSVETCIANPSPFPAKSLSTEKTSTDLPASAILTTESEAPNNATPSAPEGISWTFITIQHANTPHRTLLPTPTLIFTIETTAHFQREAQTLASQLNRAKQEMVDLKIAHSTLESQRDSVLVPGAFPVGDEHDRREMLKRAIWRRIEVAEAALARLRERQGEVVGELEARRMQLMDGLERAVQRQSD